MSKKTVETFISHVTEPPMQCDAAVIIDVLRAFTTASYVFRSGAKEILVAGSSEEARALKAREGDLITLGEEEALKPPDFDFGNSPPEAVNTMLSGRRVVQSTTSGTRGLITYRDTPLLFAGSFACAGATAAAIRACGAKTVVLVPTGPNPDGADEDRSCADYLAEIIAGRDVDPRPYLERVRQSDAARKFMDPGRPELDPRDVDFAAQLDVVDFALRAHNAAGQLVLRPSAPATDWQH